MKACIVVFPGSNCEKDCQFAIEDGLHGAASLLFHKEDRLPPGVELVILPGGFAHGDYLRCGAIAQFSPIMGAVKRFAAEGGLVWGICNGFQVLTECGLLPGALLRNKSLSYVCKDTYLKVERDDTPFTRGLVKGQVLRIPVGHGEGNYFIDPEGLRQLEDRRQILYRYVDAAGNVVPEASPNGALGNIAGIVNAAGNVCGMMPHPDRCADPILGNADGLALFQAIDRHLAQATAGSRS
ncbi:MAG: phosphoribosylformylglycinamidine synthase subunit PurQ [Acidobacteriota bacterium]